MKRATNTIFLGGLAAFAGMALLTGCGGGGSSDAIATVNGESITTAEFNSYMALKPDIRVQTQNGAASLPVDGTIGFQTLQDLVAQKLTVQLAKDRNIYPTDAQISAEIEFQKKLKPNFLVALSLRGLTLEMIRKSLALDLIQEKLLTQDIKVTKQDVEKYIKENPKEFVEPERVDLQWILVRDLKVQQAVDRELSAGMSFVQVALKHSDDPNVQKTQGRVLDERTGQMPTLAGLPSEIRARVQASREGQVTEWVRLLDGYAKFFVKKKVASRSVVMDESKREYLRRLLAKQQGQQARDLNKDILRKLKDSKITIITKAYQDPWKQAYEDFKQNSKLDELTGTTKN